MLEVRTFQPPAPSTEPLQMAIYYNNVPGISQPAYRRLKEARKKSANRPRVPKIVFGRKHQRENGLLWKRSKKHTQAIQKKEKKDKKTGIRIDNRGKLIKGYGRSWVLKRPEWERKKGLRIALGTMKWEGTRLIYEIYMPKKDGTFFHLHLFEPCTNSAPFVIEFDMYDFRSFLKETSALNLFEKRRKKYMKKFNKMLDGHNEKTEDVGPAFQLFLFERIKLLDVGQEPRPIVETVNGPHTKDEKKKAMDAKKALAKMKSEKRKQELMDQVEDLTTEEKEGEQKEAGKGADAGEDEGDKEAGVVEAVPVAEDGKPPLPLLVGGKKKEEGEEGEEGEGEKKAGEEGEEGEGKNIENEENTASKENKDNEENTEERESGDIDETDVTNAMGEVADDPDEEDYESDVSDVDDFEDNVHRESMMFKGK